ncbi:MAG: protein-L-isoaspartate(D-aspartate) O-methyltransferase [Cryomorphaceae bacterium]|jgi:protein-L-isoaspartate(D-aspartate) O-methyltransferase|nr:protein-L-isoaspartate(D-aspartate) O-methyltransferase [Cryomorphaceae bacterium]
MLIKNKELVDYLKTERACNIKIVDIMGQLDRSNFLPEENVHLEKYLKPIPIGFGQTMSAPFIVASMTDLLELSGGEKVLEIGSGCGYQTAVLMRLGAEVFSVEYVSELVDFGKANLQKIGLNPNIRCGDGYFGWQEEAPFDRIIIAATAPKVPEKLVEQLKVGGKMVFPLKKEDREFMVRLTKNDTTSYSLEWLYGVIFVPFVGEIRK